MQHWWGKKQHWHWKMSQWHCDTFDSRLQGDPIWTVIWAWSIERLWFFSQLIPRTDRKFMLLAGPGELAACWFSMVRLLMAKGGAVLWGGPGGCNRGSRMCLLSITAQGRPLEVGICMTIDQTGQLAPWWPNWSIGSLPSQPSSRACEEGLGNLLSPSGRTHVLHL